MNYWKAVLKFTVSSDEVTITTTRSQAKLSQTEKTLVLFELCLSQLVLCLGEKIHTNRVERSQTQKGLDSAQLGLGLTKNKYILSFELEIYI